MLRFRLDGTLIIEIAVPSVDGTLMFVITVLSIMDGTVTTRIRVPSIVHTVSFVIGVPSKISL